MELMSLKSEDKYLAGIITNEEGILFSFKESPLDALKAPYAVLNTLGEIFSALDESKSYQIIKAPSSTFV